MSIVRTVNKTNISYPIITIDSHMSLLTLFEDDIPEDLEAGYLSDDSIISSCKPLAVKDFSDSGESKCDYAPNGDQFISDRWKCGEYEKPRIHLLRKDDTMSSICRTYNVSVR